MIVVFSMLSLVLVACSNQPSPTLTVQPKTTVSSTPSSSNFSTPAASKPSTSPSPSASPQFGGILREISYASPTYLGDPVLIQDSGSNMTAIPTLEALVVSDNAGQMHPILATDWNIAQDGKSITFNLRKGVKFQDGTDFNATAAKWNLDRFIAAKLTQAAQWSSVDIVSDYSIRINLNTFQNTILNGLEGSPGMMVSPTAAQKNGIDWLKLNPVGTGPFKLKSYSRDVSVEYTRNDSYWGPKPYLDGILYNIVADTTTARISFESGAADVLSSRVDSVTSDLIQKGYKLENRPGPMINLVPDSKRAGSQFADVRVRQALSYAIDRESIAKTLGYGLWEVVYQPSSAQQFGHIDNVPYKYDPDKAKQLLSAAYPQGLKTTIITQASFGKDQMVAIQAQLAAVGITADINTIDAAAYNDQVSKGWNGLLYATQGATDTNYAAFVDRYYGSASIRYPVMAKPAGLTDLIEKALATPDYNTEKGLCQQAVKLIVDDSTAVPLFIQSASYVLRNTVHDTNFSNLGGSGFRWTPGTAWLSK